MVSWINEMIILVGVLKLVSMVWFMVSYNDVYHMNIEQRHLLVEILYIDLATPILWVNVCVSDSNKMTKKSPNLHK